MRNLIQKTIYNAMNRGSHTLMLAFAMLLMLNISAFAQPVIIAPADSAIGQPQSLTLAWEAVEGALSYRVQVSEGNTNFANTIYNVAGVTDTTFFVTNLNLQNSYYWRVNVTTAAGTSAYSETRMFTVWDQAPNSPAPVGIGTAGNYVILAKAAISTVPASAITGDIAVSPAAQTYITGFDLTDATGYSTSSQITGKVFAADMANPTPVNLTTAVGDMETAFVDAAGRSNPDFIELHVGDIGGKLLIPGLYKWSGTVTAPSSFVIAGGEDDVWIFQIAEDLTVASDINVTLTGGAQAHNIFWQVSGEVSIGTNTHFEGIILSKTAVKLLNGASLNGRILAQTAVTLDANQIVEPVFGNVTSIADGQSLMPGKISLFDNYPNPFNPTTEIRFELAEQTQVRLAIYDMTGREVAVLVSESRSAGVHRVSWNAGNASSGVYLYRLTANGQNLTGKMTLLK
jgi:hypothetical protein